MPKEEKRLINGMAQVLIEKIDTILNSLETDRTICPRGFAKV